MFLCAALLPPVSIFLMGASDTSHVTGAMEWSVSSVFGGAVLLFIASMQQSQFLARRIKQLEDRLAERDRAPEGA
jgi:hypothetical protein